MKILNIHVKYSNNLSKMDTAKNFVRNYDGRFMLIDERKVPSKVFLIGFPKNINRFHIPITLLRRIFMLKG